MHISKQLKKLREKSKLSASACARSIGVSQSTYRDWENGRSISGEPYLKIASLFKVSLSELFGMRKNDLTNELQAIENELNTIASRIISIQTKL